MLYTGAPAASAAGPYKFSHRSADLRYELSHSKSLA
jgi:hypothetical protein